MAPCCLGSLVEVLVNATGAPKTEDILVTAYSPSGRELRCPLKKIDEGHSAIFKPDEAGIWEIAITYQGKHIQGGPFTCAVFDSSGVSVHGLDGAMPFKAHSFEIDARGVGVSGELHVDIVHDKRSLVCSVEKLVENKYRVTFMPRQNGKHRVYIYFNGYDVKGSPFIMRVGTKGRSGKTRSSPSHDSSRLRSESPSMHFTTSHLTSVRRDLYSPQNASYSPQISPTQNEDRDYIKTSKEIYSNRMISPKRDLYSPRLVEDQQMQKQYSTTYRSEIRKETRTTESPLFDYSTSSLNRDNDTYSKRYTNISKTNLHSPKDDSLYSTSYISKLRSERKTESPVLISSPINVSF
jgi:filamin